MPTALPELDEHILQMLENRVGVRALELMNELDSNYSESDIQRAVASLISTGRVTLTSDRRLVAEGRAASQ